MLLTLNDCTITNIEIAINVPYGTGSSTHKNRRFHGLVMNDSTSSKLYRFSDGTTMETLPDSVFYLPEHSSYIVKDVAPGGCWAINFYMNKPIQLAPFSIKLRNHLPVQRIFKESIEIYMKKKPFSRVEIIKNLYSIISHIGNESLHSYIPSTLRNKIQPAENEIFSRYTDTDLTVSELAKLCGISVAYLRRAFNQIYSMSPKDYICSLRIDHAKALLENTSLPVSEIAVMSGYSDPCYFSREFKKRTGIAPSRYKSL
ncbi:MAG: helix-turn-helix domain-containing protein [Clostridia bacterium]|nr:helix-turn-helix domain-containing protein [Clostridia bacterium]